MGCYTSMRGDEALSRNLKCNRVAFAKPEGGGGAAVGASSAAAAAAAAPPQRQRLSALNICGALDIDGINNMLLPSES